MLKLNKLMMCAAIAGMMTAGAAMAQGAAPMEAAPAGGTTMQVPVPGTNAATASAEKDPFVKKRVSDAAARKKYRAAKKHAKSDMKEEKADAKAEYRQSKRESSAQRAAEAPDQIKPPAGDKSP